MYLLSSAQDYIFIVSLSDKSLPNNITVRIVSVQKPRSQQVQATTSIATYIDDEKNYLRGIFSQNVALYFTNKRAESLFFV
jgi:hypothetical protein